MKRAPILSSKGLLIRAALIALVYAALHLAGLRGHAAFLSGTMVGGRLALLGGLSYVLFHFAFVVGVPILLIASGVLALVERRARDA